MMEKQAELSAAELKNLAASRALEFVQSGMILGLGTGSTVAYFTESLGRKLAGGELTGISVVPTSQKTAQHAESMGIPLVSLASHPILDLAVDGADEVDPRLNLIKGMGRALLREKIVASHAQVFIVVVDESKLVSRLGVKSPLPVEIVPFEAAVHVRWLNSLGFQAELWVDSHQKPVVTDNGNFLALCHFNRLDPPGIEDPYQLATIIKNHVGIIDHGLFLDMATHVIVARTNEIQVLEK
jgi:ribose 5-phosphate isomerase A